MRLIFVDTETTGLYADRGDRLIEVAGVEVLNGRLTGRAFHTRVFPQCSVPPEAVAVHGISDGMLRDQPLFAEVAEDLVRFVGRSCTVMHNRPFDAGFFDAEFGRLGLEAPHLTSLQHGIDTLPRFRRLHPGARCSLAALCERYGLQPSDSESWHGALTDARMLARLWLAAGMQPYSETTDGVCGSL